VAIIQSETVSACEDPYFDDFAAAGKKVRISWVGGLTIIR
jgi:hypothetical protein